MSKPRMSAAEKRRYYNDRYDPVLLAETLEDQMRFIWPLYRAALADRRSLRWCPQWILKEIRLEQIDARLIDYRAQLRLVRFVRRWSLERHQWHMGIFLVVTDPNGRQARVG